MRIFGQVLGSVVVVAIIAAILYPLFAQAKNGRGPRCLSHLKRFALGTLMYASDHDERLPLRDSWLDVICNPSRDGSTYIGHTNPDEFRCEVVAKSKQQGFGYAFNSLLEKKLTTAIPKPESTIMLYDSINYGPNASDPLLSLPNPGRHGGRNIITYADGHAGTKEPGFDKPKVDPAQRDLLQQWIKNPKR